MRAVVVAGTHSGCGKTTLTLGLMAAFRNMGLKVQPFKCGPDFIDGGIHKLVTGLPARNLDIWMCGEDYVRECFYKHSERADISIIEGVMGLYDGKHNTASVAKLLNLPIILVVDAYGMAESAGALIKGFKDWADNQFINLKWIIFNRIGSEKHYLRLKNSVKDIDTLGYIPRSLNFEIPHRHLGLTIAEENPINFNNLNKLANSILKHIDLKGIISESTIKKPDSGIWEPPHSVKSLEMSNCQPQVKRIGVAYDKSFCFYYEDNLDMIKNTCSEIIQFSPLTDSSLPSCIDAIYLGGGYPELYAYELSNNKMMLKEIFDWSQSGMPIYAECGGLMYLSKGIYDKDGRFFKMAGIFPFETLINLNRRAFLGYREIVLKEDCLLGYKGNTFRGHEFHYSEIKDKSDLSGIKKLYSVTDNSGILLEDEGYLYKNTFASYIHLHFGSNSEIAENLINFIRRVQSNA